MSDGDEPAIVKCPWCGEMAHAEFVDVGVGHQRVSPWSCAPCCAQEITEEFSPGAQMEVREGWARDPAASGESWGTDK